jgi:hypothetical protein
VPSLADKQFIENADQFQPSEGVYLDDLYKNIKFVGSSVVDDSQKSEQSINQSGGVVVERYTVIKTKAKKWSFSDMAKNNQDVPTKNREKRN